MNKLIYISLLLLLSLSAQAQYNYVTHTSGSVSVAGLSVTVTPLLSPSTYSSICSVSTPYWIGQSAAANPDNAYEYSFATPVTSLKMRVGSMNPGEIVAFYVNGTQYILTADNLSPFGGSCGNAYPDITNGMLEDNSAINQVTVTIADTSIDSIRVQHYGVSGNGTTYDFAFAVDTGITINNFTDTALCVGDTMHIAYSIDTGYLASNVFSFQLSNALGSFASPVTIGTDTGNIGGVFKYVIPSTITPGTGYRVRVKASKHVSISRPDAFNIHIGAYPANLSVSSNTPVCSGDTLRLYSGSTSTGVSYQWTGASFSSTLQNPRIGNVAATASGYYIVKATLNGCTIKDSVNVTIKTGPAAFTASANTPVCQGDTLKLSAANTSTVTWAWAGPGSFSSSAQSPNLPNVQPAATGKYYVTATTANGCYRKDSINITVNPLPANCVATSNTPICQGDTLKLDGASTTTGVSYSWVGPGGLSYMLQSPLLSNAQPTQSGNYILSVTLNNCSVKDTVAVTIKPTPVVPPLTANTPVCTGQTLDMNTTAVTGASYQWEGPGGYTASVQNATRPGITFAMAGFYKLKIALNGCPSAWDSIPVIVLPAPDVTIVADPGDTICDGSIIKFRSVLSGSATSYTYQWYKNTFPADVTSSYTDNAPTDNDSYLCVMTASGSCATAYVDTSNVIALKVLPVLAAGISINAVPNGPVATGDLITFNTLAINGGNNPAYRWQRNGSDLPGITSNVWSSNNLDNSDMICVFMTSNYTCAQPDTASSCLGVLVYPTAIGKTKLSNGLKIFPNPVINELTIEGIAKGTRIQLYDVLGRLVTDMTSVKEIELVNTAHLIKGTYLLRLTDSNNNKIDAKLVKE